jgi:AraC-like DNA-binding protein
MTNSRHADPDRHILARTFGVTFHPQKRLNLSPPGAQGWDQLIHSAKGLVTVHTDDCSWAVPPHRAIFVPGKIRPRVEMHGEVALGILYLKTGPKSPKTCSVVNVTPLLRELIGRAIALGALDARIPAHKHLHAVLKDEVKTLEAIPLQLPRPKDERARRFAESEDERQSGAGRRTLERLFLEETGMTLGQWLRRRSLQRALRLLAAGQSVKQTAAALGYSNPGAFIAMFRRELGATPTQYFHAR